VTHDEDCPRSGKWFKSEECRRFSTDGTAMGAMIAHQMGTTDEDEIKQMIEEEDRNNRRQALTGMEEEQAEWESDADVLESGWHLFH